MENSIMTGGLKTLTIILEDIKFQHTIFAMPFAMISIFLASEGAPPVNKFVWICVALAGARTSALVFNRIADAAIDKENPRTKDRAIPSNRMSKSRYTIFLLLSICVFVFACYQLNALCLYLSPLALFIVLFYSLTKRFTSLSHFFLGLALSLSPIGAWIAMKEDISIIPVVLGCAVVFWLAGFDIIYSCQDVEFDTKYRLRSFPQKYGVEKALQFAMLFHFIMLILLFSLSAVNKLGLTYMSGVVMIAILLWYEHSIVRPDDLTRVNIAFFTVNGIISILLMATVIVDCLLFT